MNSSINMFCQPTCASVPLWVDAPVLSVFSADPNPALAELTLTWDGTAPGEWDLYQSPDGATWTYFNAITGFTGSLTFAPTAATQPFIQAVGTNDAGHPGTPVTEFSNAVNATV